MSGSYRATSTPVRTVNPTSEPVALSELKKQLSIAQSYTDHDAQLALLLTAAREQFEADTGVVCIDSRWTLSLDAWPAVNDGIRLLLRPVSSVVSITYYDGDGTQQTWSSSNYTLDNGRVNPAVWYTYGVTLPTLRAIPNRITVTYQAGYSAASVVPVRYKQAILLLAAHWFEQRTPVVIGSTAQDVPLTYDLLVKSCGRASYP